MRVGRERAGVMGGVGVERADGCVCGGGGNEERISKVINY